MKKKTELEVLPQQLMTMLFAFSDKIEIPRRGSREKRLKDILKNTVLVIVWQG